MVHASIDACLGFSTSSFAGAPSVESDTWLASSGHSRARVSLARLARVAPPSDTWFASRSQPGPVSLARLARVAPTRARVELARLSVV